MQTADRTFNPNTNPNHLPVSRSGPQSAFYQQPLSHGQVVIRSTRGSY